MVKEVWDDREVGRAEAWHQVKGLLLQQPHKFNPHLYRLLTSGPWKNWPDAQLLRDYNSCIVIVWVTWINLSVEVVGQDCLLDTSLKSENQTTCRKVKRTTPPERTIQSHTKGTHAREPFSSKTSSCLSFRIYQIITGLVLSDQTPPWSFQNWLCEEAHHLPERSSFAEILEESNLHSLQVLIFTAFTPAYPWDACSPCQ